MKTIITSTSTHLACGLISVYQWLISPLIHSVSTGGGCRFPVSCSQNFKLQIKRHGLKQGLYLGSQQLKQCHPWGSTDKLFT